MFKLNIECSKDFEELHIKFKDGTSISTGPEEPKEPKTPKGTGEPKSPKKSRKKLDSYLDTDADFSHEESGPVIHPPEIEDRKRDPSVASELQELDI